MILAIPSCESMIYYNAENASYRDFYGTCFLHFFLFSTLESHKKISIKSLMLKWQKSFKRELKSIKIHGWKVADNFVDSRTWVFSARISFNELIVNIHNPIQKRNTSKYWITYITRLLHFEQNLLHCHITITLNKKWRYSIYRIFYIWKFLRRSGNFFEIKWFERWIT